METEFLAWLREILPDHPRLLLGPGDDAAVMKLTHAEGCVVTSDMLNDGTDFLSGQCDWQLVGRKALAVNLSDLAAMAARPAAGIVSLLLPRVDGLQIAKSMYQGLLTLAAEFELPIAGGDTNSWDGPTVVCVTLIGETTPYGYWTRSGAKPGDWILVTGAFGGSILGHQFAFTPRVREALQLNADYEIHAATDVSDGLSLDLANITEASGCGAEIEIQRIPIAEDARRLSALQKDSALEHALADGEDFELILAVPAKEAKRLLSAQPLGTQLSCIGRFTNETGLWTIAEDGRRESYKPRGFRH